MTRKSETKPAAAGLGDNASRDQLDQVQVSADAGDPTRFLIQFLTVLVAGLASTGGLYAVVDPHDQFPIDLYEPLLADWTQVKVKLLARQEVPPQTFVLGSSRAMPLEPSYVVEAGLGAGPAFSLAIPSATSRDVGVLYDYLVEEYGAPEAVVITVDLDLREEVPVVTRGSKAHPELAGAKPGVLDSLEPLGEAYSIRGIRDSLRVLYYSHVAGYPIQSIDVREDGGTEFPKVERQLAADTFDLGAAIDEHYRAQVRAYYAANQPAYVYLDHLARVVEAAAENGTEVYLYAAPVHPDLDARVRATTPWYDDYEREALARLAALCGEAVHVFDYSQVDSFGGDPDNFFDGWHYLHANGRRIVDAMAAGHGSLC